LNEVWSAGYWIDYAGIPRGIIGFASERFALKRFDYFITVSRFNKDRLVSYDVDPHRIIVIRPGVRFNDIARAEKRLGEEYDLVFVGRLVREKGVRLLLDVVKPLEAELGREVRVAIGGTGPELEVLKKSSKTMGIGNRITFLGKIDKQDEVYSLLKSSKVFLYPAAPEGGWSLAILEANAAGVPVVSSRQNGIGTSNEIIQPPSNGMIVESDDPKAFAKTIAQLLANERGRFELTQSCKEFARQFDWDAIGATTLELYQRLAKR
jgi:glycosyltransferase involved in cell wall biosynthesis